MPILQHHGAGNAGSCLGGAVLSPMPSWGWPLGTASRVGRRLQGDSSCAVSPAVPCRVTGWVWGALSPSGPSAPDTTSAFQASPAPALQPNRNEVSSRAALIRYEPQIEDQFLKKSHLFYPDKHSHVFNSAFAAEAFCSPPSLEPPGSQHSWTQLLLALLAASPRSVPPEGSPLQGLDGSSPSHGDLSKPSVCPGTRGAHHDISVGFSGSLHTWQSQ